MQPLPEPRGAGQATAGSRYTQRLTRLDGARWRRVLHAQAPYRWNIRRLDLGRTLDIGGGIGRNLLHLDGNGVLVDHNRHSVDVARSRGLTAYTTEEFPDAPEAQPRGFDSLLLAHVVEHVGRDEAVALISSYLPYLRLGGRVCLITPQESGYRSDPTHVRFVDFEALDDLCRALGLTPTYRFSFPFPRAAGRSFRRNEFVMLAALHARVRCAR